MTKMPPRVVQEEGGWSSEDGPIQLTKPSTSDSEKASIVHQENVIVTDGIEIGSSAQSQSPPTYYPSYGSNCTNVVRGGFGVAKENTHPGLSKASRQYPPPSNADYYLTSDGRHPKNQDSFEPTLDGAAKECINQQRAEEARHRADTTTETPEGRKSGEDLAKDINFDRTTWIMTAPGANGVIYSADEQRQDFIDNINAGAELEYCTKCKKKHIPPGSPITLQDRDTCGAYLPDWFPAESVDKPWDALKDMLNKKLILDEMAQGFGHKPNPDTPQWDLEFHDDDPKWKAIGRRGGWWKCRSTPDAPLAEQTCKLCHRTKNEEQRAAAAKKGPSVLEQQKSIQDFMDKRVKEAGLRDRAIVEERFRKEGVPQHFGPEIPEETPGLYRDSSSSSSSSIPTDSAYAADNESTKRTTKRNFSKCFASKSIKS